jgi:hypothetical protein
MGILTVLGEGGRDIPRPEGSFATLPDPANEQNQGLYALKKEVAALIYEYLRKPKSVHVLLLR